MGSDEGGRERGDEGGATQDGVSTYMPRDASDGRVSGLVVLISVAVVLSLFIGLSKKLFNKGKKAKR